MSNSLRAGQVDAISTYEPYVSLATNIGYGKVLASSHDILPNHPCCLVVASDKFIANHPDTLKIMFDIHKIVQFLLMNILRNLQVNASRYCI